MYTHCDVQREWRAYRGLDQLKTAGKHFNIFKDMFGGQSFRPLGFMEVAYGEKMVHRGTILTPSEVCICSSVCVCVCVREFVHV